MITAKTVKTTSLLNACCNGKHFPEAKVVL